MSEDTEQDRSELPTRYKLQQARRRGAVARGADLGFFIALAAFCVFGWFRGDAVLADLSRGARDALVTSSQIAGEGDSLLRAVALILEPAVRALSALLILVFASVLVMELLQTGFVFSATPLRFDFTRLNPAQGLKRIVSLRLLLETLKNVLKLTAFVAVGYLVIRYVLADLAGALPDAGVLAAAMRKLALRMLAIALAVLAVFVIFDQLIARRSFLKQMRMSRREVKREHRDREGDPRLKQRRRQLHAQFVKTSKSLKNVRGSDVLVTNPTHYAVALRYDAATMTAPKIVGSGVEHIALRMRRLAFVYGVPTVESRALARALATLPLDTEVPEQLFKPVADIYLDLREARQRHARARSDVA